MKKSFSFFVAVLSMTACVFILNSQSLYAQSDLRLHNKKYSGQKFEVTQPSQYDGPALVRNVPSGLYPTIQSAINAANNGDIIMVAAGTYQEDIIMNKQLSVRGANYLISPNPSGSRGAESIIQPATSQPDPNAPSYEINFYLGPNGSNSTIDGFTFDGDNPTLVSSVNINGANIDAADAIAAYDGMANTKITNNIIKNINYTGVDFDNFVNGVATFDNIIMNNNFDNVNVDADFGVGVYIGTNCYASITYNVMTRTRIGVQTGNFYSADLGTNHSISNNTIDSYRLAIWHNLAYTGASTFDILDNVITTQSGAPNNIGMEISSIQSSVAVNVSNNNITGATEGYDLWNCPTTSTVTVTGGTLTSCKVGVFANNYDGYDEDAASSIYAMTGVTMTNCDTAIRVRDNSLNSNSSTVALNINNATNIVNRTVPGGIGLLIEGADASVVFNGAVPIDFSLSLSKYIRLATNGVNVPSANINAQGVQFGGTAGAGMTNAQLFAVEDKIDHKIDWANLGFVSVKANNDYVTTNSFYPPNTASALIQRGVDASASGDTANVNTGNYTEQIEINKDLV
ncbi:MAG: DUF1565 domain-containing protein, partial [Ignavibacteria bacterium]